jgi:hypothetical protein
LLKGAISKVSRVERTPLHLCHIHHSVSHLPEGPRNPVAWHSSRNTRALYFSAREHISLQIVTHNIIIIVQSAINNFYIQKVIV